MNHPSPLFFMDMGYAFFFNMPCEHEAYILWACIFSFFLTWLLSMWHTFFGYASFHIFFITHIIDIWREWSWLRSFYFMDGWWIMLISSVWISHMNIWVRGKFFIPSTLKRLSSSWQRGNMIKEIKFYFILTTENSKG